MCLCVCVCVCVLPHQVLEASSDSVIIPDCVTEGVALAVICVPASSPSPIAHAAATQAVLTRWLQGAQTHTLTDTSVRVTASPPPPYRIALVLTHCDVCVCASEVEVGEWSAAQGHIGCFVVSAASGAGFDAAVAALTAAIV